MFSLIDRRDVKLWPSRFFFRVPSKVCPAESRKCPWLPLLGRKRDRVVCGLQVMRYQNTQGSTLGVQVDEVVNGEGESGLPLLNAFDAETLSRSELTAVLEDFRAGPRPMSVNDGLDVNHGAALRELSHGDWNGKITSCPTSELVLQMGRRSKIRHKQPRWDRSEPQCFLQMWDSRGLVIIHFPIVVCQARGSGA